MSATTIIGNTAPARQREYIEEENDDGTLTGRGLWICPWSARATALSQTGVAIGTASPENPYAWATRRTVNRTRAGTGAFAEITVYYRGVTSSGNLPESFGEWLVGSMHSPIQAHPRFKSDIAGSADAPLNGALFAYDRNLQTRVFVKFREILANGDKNPLAGAESFFTADVTWRWHEFSTTPDYDISSLNKIFSSPPGNPSTPSGHDWLMVGKSCRQQGYIYLVATDYRLSGALSGWRPEIYESA